MEEKKEQHTDAAKEKENEAVQSEERNTAEDKDIKSEDVKTEENDEATELAKQLDEANALNEELKDKLLRLHAEFDNYKKRNLKEKADIHIDGDNLAISTPQFGSITFKVSKRVHNEMIRLETTSSPLPFSIDILLSPEAESQTNIAVATKIELNPIIKPMISKPIQNMTDKFAEFLATIQY